MLIQNDNKNISHIADDKIYPCVEGIANVSEKLFKKLISFPCWHTITEKIDDDVIKKLEELYKPIEDVEKVEDIKDSKKDTKDSKAK